MESIAVMYACQQGVSEINHASLSLSSLKCGHAIWPRQAAMAMCSAGGCMPCTQWLLQTFSTALLYCPCWKAGMADSWRDWSFWRDYRLGWVYVVEVRHGAKGRNVPSWQKCIITVCFLPQCVEMIETVIGMRTYHLHRCDSIGEGHHGSIG